MQLRPGSTMTAEELREFCRERLANFKVPEYIELRDEPLPAQSGGQGPEESPARGRVGVRDDI